MCAHPNYWTHSLHQLNLHLQIESRKGENVPKSEENLSTKQLKNENNFEKNVEEEIKNQIMDIKKFKN
jgi:hypothetical protein